MCHKILTVTTYGCKHIAFYTVQTPAANHPPIPCGGGYNCPLLTGSTFTTVYENSGDTTYRGMVCDFCARKRGVTSIYWPLAK